MSISNRKTVLLAAAAAGALTLGTGAADAQNAAYGAMSGGTTYGTTGGAAYGGGAMTGRGARTGGAVLGPGGMAADAGAFDDWNNRIAPAWDQYRGQIQRSFSRIPPARLAATKAERSDVTALIQEHYNLSNERAHERLWQWQRGGGMRAHRSR